MITILCRKNYTIKIKLQPQIKIKTQFVGENINIILKWFPVKETLLISKKCNYLNSCGYF